MGVTEDDRLAFKPMLVTEKGFTDELLRQHTQEAESLSTKFETMRHILEVYSLVDSFAIPSRRKACDGSTAYYRDTS